MTISSSIDRSALEQMVQASLEALRVVIVGGIPFGVVVAGLGSRLAMLLLRLTSPDRVLGMTSDDGFVIGRFTPGGTYNLLMLGAGVGIVGAGAYRLVAPRLIGPVWFRRATVGLASAAVVGSMLLHDDGIDFLVLGPTWLAIGLFVALPGLFGAFIGSSVEWAACLDAWPAQGRRRWAVPLVLVGLFPLTFGLVGLAIAVLLPWSAVRRLGPVERIRSSRTGGVLIQAGWLIIAGLGLAALLRDIAAIV